MTSFQKNIQKWIFALVLATPVFFVYTLHFLNYDKASTVWSGFIQWEHLLYMGCAREYVTGNASFFYEWPILNNFGAGAVFFQPQFLALGYLWKWFPISPGVLMTIFGLFFTVLTLRTVVSIIDKLLPDGRHNKLITVLFCWGGGLLSLAGLLLNFTYFKGNIQTIPDRIFWLDPANGSWSLNFGRSLIYPLEAYYHFLFVTCIWFVLKRDFVKTFLLMLLLIVSHPYTSIEIISIVLVWISIEVFYLKNTTYKKKDFLLMLLALLCYFFLYGFVMNRLEIYRQINRLNALDWGYRAWHFVPAYALVWWLTFICVKNVAAFKNHFGNSNNRLFFCWGLVAFILSVHGFAIKPVQPIHFTRGYVYAGFFMCCIPALQMLFNYCQKSFRGKLIAGAFIFILLFDNLSWFGFQAFGKNTAGVYFTRDETAVINFFKQKNAPGIAIGSEKNYPLNAAIQLYSITKSWIPHPFLTFDIGNKRAAVDSLFQKNILAAEWKTQPVYLYCDKKEPLPININTYIKVFENNSYTVYKLN